MANVSQVKAQFATDITATATATIAALNTEIAPVSFCKVV